MGPGSKIVQPPPRHLAFGITSSDYYCSDLDQDQWELVARSTSYISLEVLKEAKECLKMFWDLKNIEDILCECKQFYIFIIRWNYEQ